MKFILIITSLLLILSNCSSSNLESKSQYPGSRDDQRRERNGKLTGEGGLLKFGGKKQDAGDASGITVNSYLWRASLDTVSFMPLTSVDPFGGVIITDWYTNPKIGNERYKLNILVLSKSLTANALKVSVFKQVQDTNNHWKDIVSNPKVATDLEDKILTRARQMRVTQGN